MAGDRDLGVAFATAWSARAGRGLSGWEVTAATGVRGLRLLHEGGAFDHFLLTEAHPEAAAALARNAAQYPGAVAALGDGRNVPGPERFDYVDLDPYGSPIEFVPAAIAAVRDGGVLAVTATDLMVLAGVQKGACERRYGARPIRGRLGPEGGLRILLAFLAREARAVDRTVRPLLAYSRDHHVRAYLRVDSGSGPRGPDPISEIDPRNWSGPSVGEGGPYGPLWVGPLLDPDLIRDLRSPAEPARPRETERFLARLAEEAVADVPFYYEANRLAHDLGLASPPPLMAFVEGLRKAGFRAARTHARPEGFRTDAPRAEVLALARATQ
jgi:tRNA (guanine26-N2/guanine27-N2)-dimethyltransferase